MLERYVHGPGVDETLIWYEGASVGTTYLRRLRTNWQGSVVLVADNAGNGSQINSYSPYGIPGADNQGRFQYTGQAWIPELGMYHYKARIYSPTLGRFLQTDPIGYEDQINLYAYVGNDPINKNDPTGEAGCATIEDQDGNPMATDCEEKRDYGPSTLQVNYVPLTPSMFSNRQSNDDNTQRDAPQSGLLDDLKDAYCSLPSFGGGVSAGGYAGLGGGVTGEAAFDPSSGRISLSAGLNVGVGVGFSVAGTGNTGRGVSSAPVFGSVGVNANVAAGPVRAGVAGTLIDSSGFNPRYNGVNGGLRAGGGLTANANLTARGGTAFQILPSCN